MNNSDHEDAIGEAEVDITDLNSPGESGQAPDRHRRRSLLFSSRARGWMSLAMIAATTLLVVVVLVSLPHAPEKATSVAETTLPPYNPSPLSVGSGLYRLTRS